MQTGQRIPHLTFKFGARHQGGDTIDHQNIDRARADQRVGDFERLFAGIGLRDQEVVKVDEPLP